MKKSFIKILVTIIFFSYVLSCQQEETLKDLNPTLPLDEMVYNNTKTIRTNGKYLDFMSFDEFDAIRSYQYYVNSEEQSLEYDSKHPKEIAEELGFYSMGHLFEDILISQKEYIDNLELKLSEEELSNLNLTDDEVIFSDMVLKYKEILNLDIHTGNISLKVFDPDIAYLLDENGVVLVGGVFYQYSDSFIKVSPYTHEFSMDLFLETDENDSEKEIFYNNIIVETSENLNNNAKARTTVCTDFLSNTRLYINGYIKHIKATEIVSNCESNPDCWATGQLECCFEPTYIYKSIIRVENYSYTTCGGFLCLGGPRRWAIDELGMSGSYSVTSLTGNNPIASGNFNIVSNNVSGQNVAVYSGGRAQVVVTATFTGNYSIPSNSSASCYSTLID